MPPRHSTLGPGPSLLARPPERPAETSPNGELPPAPWGGFLEDLPAGVDMGVNELSGDGVGRIRVLVADDHPVVRTGLAAVIAQEPDLLLVAQAENGERAVALFRQHQPDVVLMDLRMPVLDGV